MIWGSFPSSPSYPTQSVNIRVSDAPCKPCACSLCSGEQEQCEKVISHTEQMGKESTFTCSNCNVFTSAEHCLTPTHLITVLHTKGCTPITSLICIQVALSCLEETLNVMSFQSSGYAARCIVFSFSCVPEHSGRKKPKKIHVLNLSSGTPQGFIYSRAIIEIHQILSEGTSPSACSSQ